MSNRKKTTTKAPELSLAVQYASAADELPTRPQLRRWVRAALSRAAQITLRIVDAEEGQELNRNFRGKDYPTNVLTFVYDDAPPAGLAGDIVLCAPVVMREAREQRKEPMAHYAHLVIHGVLHLQGYEHENEREAEEMERLETALMTKLGYADPYTAIQ